MTYAVPAWFEWDDAKNVANQEKHGVSFEIIGARWATRRERQMYRKHMERQR